MISYLDVEDALQVMDKHGFSVRDPGLLASALARPAAAVMGAGVDPTLSVKAAVLLESVARFHPMIDGKKRTAWTLMVLMLWINGHRHNFCADEGSDLVLGVASGQLPAERSAAAIAAHMVAREPNRQACLARGPSRRLTPALPERFFKYDGVSLPG